MAYDFEDHCWQDVMPAELIELSRRATREVKIGPAPALLAIDLYEQVYRGGNVPLAQAVKECPTACGEFAWNAIEPTQQLFAAARAANLPVFYSTNDMAPFSRSAEVQPTRSKGSHHLPTDYDIRPEWKPRADLLLSLSPLTMAHELARAVLAEQIYRGLTMLRGHPYAR